MARDKERAKASAPPPISEERKARLAKKLRENLRKRKQK